LKVKELLEDNFMNLSTLEKSMVTELADLLLGNLTEEELLYLCPDDYGATIEEDHRVLVWNRLVDYLSLLDSSARHSLHIRGRRNLDQTIDNILQSIVYLDLLGDSRGK
jgi:hypothetical protein